MPKKLHPKDVFNGNYEFILGAHTASQAPKHRLPEIAFLGASNVGKSSLINALVGKKIAIVSNTPGRTRQLNFFNISNHFMLVDMPGYGFAKAANKHIDHWQQTSVDYFINRVNLKRLFLLIDPTKGLKTTDREAIEILNKTATQFQIVLTKIDKFPRSELQKICEEIEKESQLWAASMPGILAVSASKGYGIFELQDVIVEIL